jgi:hypothetical protein
MESFPPNWNEFIRLLNAPRWSVTIGPTMIRPAIPTETDALLGIAIATGLFSPEEADVLLRRPLEELHAGRLGDQHFAHVSCEVVGQRATDWVYFSANAEADGVWDLWWMLAGAKVQRAVSSRPC